MTGSRRIIWLLTLTAFLITANGCSSSRWQPINEELDREGSGLYKESGQAVGGYQLHNGPETDYLGWVRLADQDTLVFWHLDNSESSDFLDYENSNFVEPTIIAGPRLSLAKVKTLKIVEDGSGGAMLVISIFGFIFLAESMSNFKVKVMEK